MNTLFAAPEPRLMHKRPMRRIHQSDNSLIHMRRQIASQRVILNFSLNFGSSGAAGIFSGNRVPGAFTYTHTYPSRSSQGKCPAAIRSTFNLSALVSDGISTHRPLQASNSTRDNCTAHFPIKMPIRKRNPPVRTRIPQSKRLPFRSPPNHHGISSRVAVLNFRPRISSLRKAGYQKSHKTQAPLAKNSLAKPPSKIPSPPIRYHSFQFNTPQIHCIVVYGPSQPQRPTAFLRTLKCSAGFHASPSWVQLQLPAHPIHDIIEK